MVAHRRAGKTTACLNHLIRDALQNSKTKYAYIAPTYKQAKNIAWDILKEYANKIDNVRFNESELRADFKNLSRITLYGSDNPDALRGMGLWGVVYDEYSQQPSNIHSEIIRPTLADHKGYAIWIGTPKGKNDFWRLYHQARKDENWLAMLETVDSTGLILPEELEDSSRIMTPDEFQQEWYCSFEAAVKGAFYSEQIALARKQGRIKIVPYDESLKVHTVWDIGVGQAMGVGFFQVIMGERRMIDYWEGSNKEGIPQAIKSLQNKNYIYGQHFAPHDIETTDISTGKTRKETAEELGIEFEIVPSVPVDDGINAAKLFFNKLWIDEERCQIWLDYIAQYHQEWDEKRGMFRQRPYHDFTSHAADVLRYAALVENEMTNEDYTREEQARIQQNRQRRLNHELL